jgi:hypothetical protein
MVSKKKVGDKEIKESRIKNLKPTKWAIWIANFKQDGAVAVAKQSRNYSEVTFQPILPNSKTTFTQILMGKFLFKYVALVEIIMPKVNYQCHNNQN